MASARIAMTTVTPNAPNRLSWLRVATGATQLVTLTGGSGFKHAVSLRHGSGSLETMECADTASLVRGNFDIRVLTAPFRMSKVGPQTPCWLKQLGTSDSLDPAKEPNCQAESQNDNSSTNAPR